MLHVRTTAWLANTRERCGELAGRAPVQRHQRERGMFLRLHNEIPDMRIGVENGLMRIAAKAGMHQGHSEILAQIDD